MNTILEIPLLPPRSIVLDPPLSDEEFERLSESSGCAFLERDREGKIIVNAPAGGSTSSGNNEIGRQLGNWWIQHRQGRVFDSSGGFFLPDGSVLGPDAAYATAEQLKGLSRDDLAHFLRLTPAFIIELRSPSDSLAQTTKKMEAWMTNGVEVGWLVDPYSKSVHVYQAGFYQAGSAATRIETGSVVAGTGPVQGFVLDLEEIWRCFE
jgi:Uma2 family endonuclease